MFTEHPLSIKHPWVRYKAILHIDRLSTNLFPEPVPAGGLVQMERCLQVAAEDADGAGERGGPEGRVGNKNPPKKPQKNIKKT